MIPTELEAEILRLFHAEQWRVGTIAAQLGVHHSAIERVITQAGGVRAPAVRGTMVEPYVPFIREVLEKYPTLSASRLYEMVRQRGYPGRPDHFRHLVARHRPRRPAEAYLRVRTLPGEQGQVDWGHFGKLTIGRALRPLLAFVMVLSFSRMTFLRFYLDAQMPNFLRGHVDAFAHFGGVPRVLLYDNLKSAVLERQGDAIRFHPKLLELKAHYRFDPKPVAKARGNEKGRVERKIRHIRQSFFAAREFGDLADLNEQALEWCMGLAADRPCPENTDRRVREVFVDEKPRLLPLPEQSFDTLERLEAVVRKQPYVRFDLNDYSIPHDRIRRTVEVWADLHTVRIFDSGEEIASHPRSFDRGDEIENPAHIDDLRAHKHKAKSRSILDHLHRAAPSVAKLFDHAAQRNQSLKKLTQQLRQLLDSYSAELLEQAIRDAIDSGLPHIGAVRQVLETGRKARGQPPPVFGDIPLDPKARDITVKPHALENYDHLTEDPDDPSQE